MLGFLKGKKKGNMLAAPCNGKAVQLSEVSDPTFAEKILGDGFAVVPSDGKICAPADGEVTMVFDTLHAVTLTTDNGTELLIHIGLDTVTLKGDLLVEADLEKIRAAGLDTITPVLICNTDDYETISLEKEGDVVAGEDVLRIL